MRRVWLPLSLVLFAACDSVDSPLQPDRGVADAEADFSLLQAPQLTQSPGFLWLPPLGLGSTEPLPELDAGFLPHLTVKACIWDGEDCLAELTEEYSSAGQGSSALRIDQDEDGSYFIVVWNRPKKGVEEDARYR